VYADTQAMGVEVLRNTQSITLGGSLVNTNRNLDLAISGGGFFIVKDPATQEEQFTRAGAFSLGLAGDKTYLIDAAGKRVQGVTGDIEIVTSDMAAEATDSLAFVANFDANKTAIDPVAVPFDPDSPATYHSSYTSRVFDSQGKEHSLTQYFRKVADNQWEAYSYLDGSAATPASTVMEFTTSGQLDNVGGAGTTVALPPVPSWASP
jgi:flagellar hook protein FlgE